jgi:uncharacterized protein (DUF58 family)
MEKNRKTNSSPVTISLQELVALRTSAKGQTAPQVPARALLAGGHRSRFRGRGMEFAEVRSYQPGDDIRSIDWRVTARRGKVHTKLFHEEREQPVLFALDYRRPMFFATRGRFKAVLASQLAAILAWDTLARGDRVGGVLFSELQHIELRPRSGHQGVLRLLNAMAGDSVWKRPLQQPFEPKQRLAETVQRLLRVARPGSRIELFSDLNQWDAEVEKQLAVLSRQSQICIYFVFDPLETELPQSGNFRLSDGQADLTIATGSDRIRQLYRHNFTELLERVTSFCASHRIALHQIATSDDPQQILQNRREEG